MNYKKMSIIFLIMIIPISVVLSEYVHNQIDTLTLQTQYKTMLEDSTYDAILAYEMNTMSATVAKGEDNKRYVLASVNTFFNSLATNMGVSGTNSIDLRLYVPAILFTSYDGYYIYSPTKMPKVATDDIGLGATDDNGNIYYLREGNDSTVVKDSSSGTVDTSKATTDMSNAKISYDYMLKPYIYYSASYSDSNKYNLVVNYSLDNHITVYGQIKDASGKFQPFTKSGYLIDYNSITDVINKLKIKKIKRTGFNSSGNPIQVVSDANTEYVEIDGDTAYNYINDYNYTEAPPTANANNYFGTRDGQSYSFDVVTGKRYQTGDQIIEDSVNQGFITSLKYKGQEITDSDALKYYIKAYYFSKWIDENLGGIVKASDINEEIDKNAIVPDDGEDNGINDQIKLSFTSDDKIFDIYDNSDNLINNPDSETSIFTNHRKSVIQNSILYSLNSAISTYSTNMDLLTENRLPIFSQSDWEKILGNIGMTVFLQGIPCGTKTFNDYAIVTSANNNQFINKNNLYFTKSIGGPETTSYNDYHKIDCPAVVTSWFDTIETANPRADISAQFKYDAREVEVKTYSDDDDFWYKKEDGKYYKGNPGGLLYEDKTAEVKNNLYYYDKDSTIYYDSDWNIVNDYTLIGGSREAFEKKLKEIKVYETQEVMTAYLYDHKNTGCYECIVSNNYIPVVKFDEDGEMRRTGLDTDEKLVMEIPDVGGNKWVYDDGTEYTGTVSNRTSDDELNKRKKAWYTYIAKYRNNLHNANTYANR